MREPGGTQQAACVRSARRATLSQPNSHPTLSSMAFTTPAQPFPAAAPQAVSHSRAGSPVAPAASFISQRQLPAACTQRHCRRQAACAPPAAVPAAAAAAAAVAVAVGYAPAAAAAALAAQPALDLVAALDEAPEWTLDQAVGLVFGGLLVLLYLSSTQARVARERAVAQASWGSSHRLPALPGEPAARCAVPVHTPPASFRASLASHRSHRQAG